MRWENIDHPEGFFSQLCCAYVLRFPQVPFTALCRQEMTVTGAILLYRVRYDGTVLHVQEKEGMWPMDEDDWSREAASAFLSQKAIFTFGAYATNLRRQIQKQLDAGKPDKKAIGTRLPKEPDWSKVNNMTMGIVRNSLSCGQEC